MFQPRQIDEVQQLTEVSYANMTPGAVANGATTLVGVAQAFTVGAAGSTSPATFALGDQLEIYPSPAANANGVSVSAFPTATPGTAQVYFTNSTAGSITPTAGAKYTIIATRITPTLI